MPIQTTAVTRFGISGGIWNRLGGDYSNKAASPPVFAGTIPNISATEGDSDVITDLSTYFSGATSYSISPAVEAGWNFDTVTGILTVDTDDVNTFGPYTVTGTNAAGSDNSNAFSVIISAAVATVEEANTGGWAFRREQERYRQEDEARKRRAKKEKAKQIADKLDRDIALAFIARDEGEAQRKDLERLTKLASDYRDEIIAENATIASTIEDAVRLQTFSRMQKLSRELNLMREEEMFLMLATKILLEQ